MDQRQQLHMKKWRGFTKTCLKQSGYCEDLYCDEEGKGIEQEPLPLHSEVARAIRRTASRKATDPNEVPEELFKAG